MKRASGSWRNMLDEICGCNAHRAALCLATGVADNSNKLLSNFNPRVEIEWFAASQMG
jgi:hypothetical protein